MQQAANSYTVTDWTPAGQGAPVGVVMVATADDEYPVWLGYFEDGQWYAPDATEIQVTHWMPLPASPKEAT